MYSSHLSSYCLQVLWTKSTMRSARRREGRGKTYAPPAMNKDKNKSQSTNKMDTTKPKSRDSVSVTSGTPGVDRPPNKVFLTPQKKDNIEQMQSEDTLTIDSYLLDQSTKQGTSGNEQYKPSQPTVNETDDESNKQPSVYHLAHGGVRQPSPKHRQKLNEWYEARAGKKSTDSSEVGGTFSRDTTTRGGEDDEDFTEVLSYDEERAQSGESSKRPGFWGTIFGVKSEATMMDDEYEGVYRMASNGEFTAQDGVLSATSYIQENIFGEEYLKTKQQTAYFSIGITAIQLLVLCVQLAVCGIAPLEVNPFVGPYPDSFSEWGGKNPYLMIEAKEWWRLLSPSLLHVGVLHLLVNAFCQLEPIALFEREWGSTRWLLLYLISSIGAVAMSSLVDPNTIGVGSSGPVMGLFAAKLAQVMSHTIFEVNKMNQDEMIRLDQLSSVLCGLLMVSILSFFTYIDSSGHIGGLLSGFFSGMILFCNPIRSCCWKFWWAVLGLAGLSGFFTYIFYSIFYLVDAPDADLANVCEYFRFIFPEDYVCGCLLW